MKRYLEEWAGPLARRLGLSVFLISIFATLLISSVHLYTELQASIKNIETQIDQIKAVYLPSIGARLWVADIDSLRLDLAGILNFQSIEYLSVTEQGQTLLEAGAQSAENTITRNYPIFYEHNGKQLEIGGFTIEASTADVYQMFYANALSSIVMVAFQTFLVAALVLLLVGRRVTRHLATISTFARQLGLSNLDQHLVLHRPRKASTDPDELDILVEALATMQQQLRQSVRALSESEENLALTLDCIGDAVIATDREGLVTRMNPVAEQLTGWLVSEAIGRSVRDVFPIVDSESLEPVANPVYQALTQGEIVTLSNHTTLLAKNAEQYQIADSAAPIRNGETIIGAILVFHDVTEQYRMRQQLLDSQKHLKQHIEQTPLAVIEWDRDFVVVDWNPAAEQIFGYSKVEAVGHNSSDLIVPPETRADVEEIRQQLLSNKTVNHFVNTNINKAGETVICEWYNTPLIDEDGHVIGMASFADDISLRIGAEEKNRQQQLEQQQLLDNLLDPVITVDADGTILSFNLAAEKLFGYSEEEARGQHFRLIMPAELAENYQAYLHQSAEGIAVDIIGRAHETWLTNRAGEQFPIRLSVTTCPRIGSDKMLFIASIHDLTHTKKTEEQLRRSQKMDALGKLTGGIAHDYNNMLGIVLGYSELLRHALDEQPKLLAYAAQITQAGERGAALTKKLLGFSKQQVAEAEILNINDLLAGQRQLLEKILTARILVEMKLSSELWPVLLDKGDFEDVLMNLCINAMHAITASDGSLVIDTRNQYLGAREAESLGLTQGEYVRLSVTDTGKGMDKAVVEKIFDPFFSTKGEQGTGLGLSQVYGFMERCHGTIQVYSEPGIGTRFSLYFPRHTGEPLQNEESASAALSPLGGVETLLVVDDEPSLLALARDVLGEQGYKILCGNNGAEALELLRNNAIDLVISDVIMPGMDGYALAKKIKTEFPDTQMLIVSGFDETSHVNDPDQELKAGALAKPYSSRDLLERVRQLLDQASGGSL